jgi:hypothetical protein
MLKKLYAIIPVILLLAGAGLQTPAQETQAAAESDLLRVMLPGGAQRVLPRAVPSEITQTLDKITAAGGGKFRSGDSEVLLWAGSGYSKQNAPSIISRLTGSMETAGWKYSVEGEENGVTVFTALKEGSPRRAVVGFYGATDEALILAAMEILPVASGGAAQSDSSGEDRAENAPAGERSGADSGSAGLSRLVGKWSNGNVSSIGEKNLYTGQITASNGTIVWYKFYADGRFEHVGYMKSTMFGCTTDLFNDKRGRVEVSGNQITFIPTKNFWRNTYSCSPQSNKERDYVLERETYTFSTKTDEYGKQLICLANAKGERCFRREE